MDDIRNDTGTRYTLLSIDHFNLNCKISTLVACVVYLFTIHLRQLRHERSEDIFVQLRSFGPALLLLYHKVDIKQLKKPNKEFNSDYVRTLEGKNKEQLLWKNPRRFVLCVTV